MLMGQALLQAGNISGAEAELLPLQKAQPKNAEIQVLVGRLYLAKSDLPRARQAFSTALELQPESVTALNGLVTIDITDKKLRRSPRQARAAYSQRVRRMSRCSFWPGTAT